VIVKLGNEDALTDLRAVTLWKKKKADNPTRAEGYFGLG
jgi:hypothetical protein